LSFLSPDNVSFLKTRIFIICLFTVLDGEKYLDGKTLTKNGTAPYIGLGNSGADVHFIGFLLAIYHQSGLKFL
jgi:hypothetical protein